MITNSTSNAPQPRPAGNCEAKLTHEISYLPISLAYMVLSGAVIFARRQWLAVELVLGIDLQICKEPHLYRPARVFRRF